MSKTIQDILKTELRVFLRWLMSSPKKPYTYKEILTGAEKKGGMDVNSGVILKALEEGLQANLVSRITYNGVDLWIRN